MFSLNINVKICIVAFCMAIVQCETESGKSPELDLCQADKTVSSICSACSSLPYGMDMPSQACCHDFKILEICDQCTNNPVRCLKDVLDLESSIVEQKLNPNSVESEIDDDTKNEIDQVNKRYGRMFFGSRPSMYSDGIKNEVGQVNKRYGRMFFGSRPSMYSDGIKNEVGQVSKRYGRMFFGSRPSMYSGYLDKRYGRLFFGSRPLRMSLRSIVPEKQKRFGKLFIKKKSTNEEDDDSSLNKRYGRLFMVPYLDKRYGALNIAKPPRRYFW